MEIRKVVTGKGVAGIGRMGRLMASACLLVFIGVYLEIRGRTWRGGEVKDERVKGGVRLRPTPTSLLINKPNIYVVVGVFRGFSWFIKHWVLDHPWRELGLRDVGVRVLGMEWEGGVLGRVGGGWLLDVVGY